MSTIRQPKYLDNDGLRDSVIEVSFESPYNMEYVAKTILESEGMNEFETVKNQEDKSIFILNDFYRIQVLPNKVAFNNIKVYQRWTNYSPFILRIMQQLLTLQDLQINSTMIRYISMYPNVSIFDNLNGTKMKLNAFPSIDGTEIRFTMAITDNVHHLGIATIRLTDNLISQKNDTKVSVVDIQIVANNDNNGFAEILEFIHTQEKNLYFSILNENFINSLGAHYE